MNNILKNRFKMRKLVLLSTFSALAVVFRIFTFYVMGDTSRIVIYNIPIMLAGFIFGPAGGLGAALIADVSAIIYEPRWNPFFMIPASLWGLIPGIFKYFINIRDIRHLVIVEVLTHVLVTIINSFLIGSLFVHNLSWSFWAARLSLALPIMIIKMPIDIIILKVCIKRVIDPLVLEAKY
ncbi:folate family ECF transporter S component [Acholeplasma sp. OttesenSCG-928-E16]|nr:folate family ECF transporter S component [Acholeplasma sp. OttesenSCG-928-E16]